MPAQPHNISDLQPNSFPDSSSSDPPIAPLDAAANAPSRDRAPSRSRVGGKPEFAAAKERLSAKGLSIGIKATILATVFGVLPVLAVGWVAYRSADSSITAQIAQEKLAAANQLSDQLSRFLEERLANAKTVASVVSAIASDAGLENGLMTASNRAAIEPVIREQLTTFVQDYRTYANIALFDLQGEVLVQSEGSAGELNQKKFPYFQQVLKTGQPTLSEPISFNSIDGSKRYAVYAAAPVQNQAGKTIAVVAAKIPVDFIGNAVLRAASLQQGTLYQLVDSSGNIFQSLPSVGASPIGKAVAEQMPLFSQVEAQRQRIAWLGSTGNDQALHAYAPVKATETLSWSVVTSTERAVAFAPQRQLLQAIGIGTAITALVAAALGALLAERATRPIQRVAQTVEKLGQGELEARIAIRGNDELAVLGANVNQMAIQIQNLLKTLRQNAEQLSVQNQVLAKLARNEALIQGDAQAAAQAFTEAIAQTLAVERVGIWVYTSDRSSLTCLDQYESNRQQHTQGDVLLSADLPQYIQTLESQAEPVQIDLLNTEPSAAAAVLNMPIQIAGRMAGVIRCDAGQLTRFWQAEEQTFVASVANLVSIALESEFLQQEVSHLLDIVSEVEEGNLTTQARVSDRTTGLVADTFNRLIERLTNVLSQVVQAVRQVSTAANQQKALAEIVATNTEQQALAVSQVLQLTEQVEQAAQGSAAKANTTTMSLQTMQLAVEQGQSAIGTLMQGIEVLQGGTDRIVQQMKTLGEFVGLADQFVQDQSQIASLTQTLALNASLVAARASEQRDPRQFAVVAREFDSIATQVSRLAQQTNDGLLALEQRSTQIHSVVSIIDANIQNLGGLVRGFTEGVDQSNQVFSNVQTVAAAAVSAGAAVTQTSREIVDAAQAAAQVVREIATIATQTAELSQQTRSQSEEMDLLSTQLLQGIQFFQLPDRASQAEPLRVDLSQADGPTWEIEETNGALSVASVASEPG